MPEGADSVVVLIPGLTCDHRFWIRQTDALRRAGHAVTIPRLHDCTSIGSMAAEVLTATDDRLDVVGHSMGGRVALEMYARAPHRMSSLALLDTGAHPVQPGEPERRNALVGRARVEGLEAIAPAWAEMMVHPDRRNDRTLLDAIVAMVTSHSVEQYAGQIAALLGRPDAEPLLGEIECPVLVACGDHDGWSPPDQHRSIAAAIPGAELELIRDAGHMVAMERPEATSDLLLRWLGSTG